LTPLFIRKIKEFCRFLACRPITPLPGKPDETDAQYLTRVDQSPEYKYSYASLLLTPDYMETLAAFSTDTEERIKIVVDLPRSEAEWFAGVLDAFIQQIDSLNRPPKKHWAEVVTGYDVEHRIRTLVGKMA
jgi:hypothetical protein